MSTFDQSQAKAARPTTHSQTGASLDPQGVAAQSQSAELNAARSATQGGGTDGLLMAPCTEDGSTAGVAPATSQDDKQQIDTIDDLDGDWIEPGYFVAGRVDVELPTNLPSIKILIGGGFSITKYASGEKKLEMDGSIGAGVEFGELLQLDLELVLKLTLRGESLVASLVDAVKQLVAIEFAKHNVYGRLGELVQTGNDYKPTDVLRFYDFKNTAKLLLICGYAEEIVQAHRGYPAFFRNNPEVGFDARVGAQAGGEASLAEKSGTSGKGVTAQGHVTALTGVEDVGNASAQAYTETGFDIVVEKDQGSAGFGYAERQRGTDRIKTLSLNLTGQFSEELADPKGLQKLASHPVLLALLTNVLARDVYHAGLEGCRDGLAALIGLACTSGVSGAVGTYGQAAGVTASIDVRLELTNGGWSGVEATAKVFGQLEGKISTPVEIEGELQAGKVFELTADLKAALPPGMVDSPSSNDGLRTAQIA